MPGYGLLNCLGSGLVLFFGKTLWLLRISAGFDWISSHDAITRITDFRVCKQSDVNRKDACHHSRFVERGDYLNVPGLHSPDAPGVQNLLDPFWKEIVSLGDAVTAPTTDEEELDEFPLQVRPVMFSESGYLSREADTVSVDGSAELAQALVFELCFFGRGAQQCEPLA